MEKEGVIIKMRILKERVSYLQGLTEGLEVRDQSKEGRVINSIIEVLGEVVDSLDTLWLEHQRLEDFTESIDEEISLLEGGDIDVSDEEDEIEVTCPRCHDVVCFSADVMDDDDIVEVTCPNCEEIVYVNDGSFDFQHSIIGHETGVPDHQVTQDI